MSQRLLNSEAIVPKLDISHLVTEDDTPVDNFKSAKQQRLLVEPLYASMPIAPPFIVDADVGVFYGIKQEPIVPDVFLSLGVEVPEDWSLKENRAYFVWEFSKVPEVCIEIVSNQKGNELTINSPKSKRKLRKGIPQFSKIDIYAQIGIPYYVVFDPLRQIQEPEQMDGSLLKVWGHYRKGYEEITEPYWFEEVGLGLTLWEGKYEGRAGVWLRWCDRSGQVIPTGAERADAESQRADRLAERLRQMGINPDELV